MGVSNNPPRKHHYVPQFWTKRWAGSDGLALRYLSPFPGKIVAHRKPPSAIGWREALYSLPAYNNSVQDFESAFFKRIDQKASDLFDKIENSNEIKFNKEEAISFSLFITSLLHRSPHSLALLEKSTKIMVDGLLFELREKYQVIRSRHDPESFDEYFQQYDDMKRLSHLSNVFRSLILSKSLAKFISQLYWFRIDLQDAGLSLLLSDDPMIRTNGIAKADGHIALPLSPTVALIGVYERPYFQEIVSMKQKELVKAMNLQTVQSARDFVVAKDEYHDRFIRNRFGRDLRPSLIEQSRLDQPNQPRYKDHSGLD